MLLDDYTLTELLGRGTFGDVFLTTKKDSNLSFATKRMDRSLAENPKYCKYFVNEVYILRNVYHKNIVKVVDLKKTKNHYYIIMELCNGGSLKSNLDKFKKMYNKPFSEKVVQHIMRQVVSAIDYLHGLKIVHRDLKLDNILVNFFSEEDKKNVNLIKAEIKIIDFGFATHINNANLLTSTIGSPLNMDPRILKKFASHAKCAQTYDEKADIWSLGTLCYQMLVGEYAFIADNVQDLNVKVEEGTFKLPITLSKEGISFLMDMLQYDSNKRASAADISKHPFLLKCADDFSYIDLRKVLHKISYGDLYVNIKDNKTICSVVNKEGVKQLNLSPSELFPMETGTQYYNSLKPLNENTMKMNLIESKGLNNNVGNNNYSLNRQGIMSSAPIPNLSKNDPVINKLLDLKIPSTEKTIINSLIHANENPNKLSKSSQPNNTAQFYQNNNSGMVAPFNFDINDSSKKPKTEIYSSGEKEKNPHINQQYQINQPIQSPQKVMQNHPTLSDSKINQNIQNKSNIQNNSLLNRSEGNRTISSQNLGMYQFQNFQDKFSTLPPKKVSEFSFGNNQNDTFKKMNSSDRQMPNLNNNSFNNSNFSGERKQPVSSKNLEPTYFNYNKQNSQNLINQNKYYI